MNEQEKDEDLGPFIFATECGQPACSSSAPWALWGEGFGVESCHVEAVVCHLEKGRVDVLVTCWNNATFSP